MQSNISAISAIVLLPPLLVLTLGYFTKRIMLSLVAGIIAAGFIATNYAVGSTFTLVIDALWKNLEFDKFFSVSQFWQTWNLFICIFLFSLGIFVVLLQHSGGAFAYTKFVSQYIHNRKNVENSSILLSCTMFIDDYFSSLTVGSVMSPLAERYKVARSKLAFLVDSMAAPLVILCPFSSWVAAILGFLRDSGVSESITEDTLVQASPIATYFELLPFLFYSFLLFVAVWYIVRTRISYGPMKKQELAALNVCDLELDLSKNSSKDSSLDSPKDLAHGSSKDLSQTHRKLDDLHSKLDESPSKLRDFLIPVGILVISIIWGMLFSGKWQFLGGNLNFIEALRNSNAAIGLFVGGTLSLIVSFLYFIYFKKISYSLIPEIFIGGIRLMFSAVVVLILAWTFGEILREHLHTGVYLAKFLSNSFTLEFLPLIFFLVSFLISFAIGSGWGTAALIFPIAIPMVVSLYGFNLESVPVADVAMANAAMANAAIANASVPNFPGAGDLPLLFPVLGAILSGCVAGNHTSPIADTTIMSSSSTQCSVLEHVNTQFPYAIPVLIATAVSFILPAFLLQFGMLITSLVSIAVGSILVIIILRFLHYLSNRSSSVKAYPQLK